MPGILAWGRTGPPLGRPRLRYANPTRRLHAKQNGAFAMAKDIPEALKRHILPFNWDVRKVWALAATTQQIPCGEFRHWMELPLWSSVPGRGLLFDTRPVDVIRDVKHSPYQTQRLYQACLDFPVDILILEDKRWILDGIHRIAKHFMLNSTTIPARFHDESVIPQIIVP